MRFLISIISYINDDHGVGSIDGCRVRIPRCGGTLQTTEDHPRFPHFGVIQVLGPREMLVSYPPRIEFDIHLGSSALKGSKKKNVSMDELVGNTTNFADGRYASFRHLSLVVV
jgi:hypothetical protein